MQSLDEYPFLRAFSKDTHTHTHTFESHCNSFPIEVGPMTSLLPVESDENMD